MTDAHSPQSEPGNDLESQLDALMKQARDGNAPAEPAEPETPAADDTATATQTPAANNDLASQLDALMAKAGNDSADTADEPREAAADTPPPEAVAEPIADGPDEIEDALDDLEGAFDAVQDVIAEFEDSTEALADAVAEAKTTTEPEAAAEEEPAAAEAATPPAPTEAELARQEDELASQVQALLDEESGDDAEAFVSPEELIQQEGGEADAGEAEAVAEALAEPETAEQPEAAGDASPDPDTKNSPLIEQLDSLLADHAEDAISGEFESVDELLGVSGDTAEDHDEDASDEVAVAATTDPNDEEDDGLGGDFQSMDDLLGQPEEEGAASEAAADNTDQPAAAAEARREEPALELDQIDGLFEAPQALNVGTAPEADPDYEDPDAEQDLDMADGGFESLDALFAAPPPTAEERDGEPQPAKPSKSKTKPADGEGWQITLNLAMLKAAAVLLLGWTLWTCSLVNAPVNKLPDEIKQTVGWVALAVAGPGMMLVAYGVLFN